MSDNSANNRRIAKNTIYLYFRTLLIMFVSLYTSRIVLNALGVKDFGIYNAVGGFVSFFTIISGALSNAISRYITYEIGKGNNRRITTIFCTSINIQLILSASIFVLCEVLGYLYLNNKMNIPPDRLIAANWVLHFSLLAFVINLLSVPYNACIIAYERMNAYAYISIVDAILKLSVAFLIIYSSYDKLILYSILLFLSSIVVRIFYMGYCRMNFEGIRYRFIYEKEIFWDLLKFAGWNFFANAASILNSQGVTLLVNSYFGVILNSSRGIATQVDMAIKQFAQGFTTAINPQITKSYAKGNSESFFSLICNGARYSYFLILIFAVPIIFETEIILKLWLVNVPEKTIEFVRLSIIGVMITITGNSGYTACMATGNIKRYSIWITVVGSLVFFLTWVSYWLGAPVEATYVIYIFVFIGVQITRLLIMKSLINFPIVMFVKDVVFKIIPPTVMAVALSLITSYMLPEKDAITATAFRILIYFMITCICTYYLGLNRKERHNFESRVLLHLKKIYGKNS